MPEPQRIGIYGGTFDPIHIGHLVIAEEARWALQLDQVYLVPAARQPLKAAGHHASPAQRLEMVRRACATNLAFVPSDIELHRPPPSFTVETITQLRAQLGPDPEIFFILGADAARDLPHWRRAAEIIRLARLVIVGRPGYQVDLASLDRGLPGAASRSMFLEGPMLEISSTELRRRLADGRPVRYQIPDPVLAYISAEGLYQREPEPCTTP